MNLEAGNLDSTWLQILNHCVCVEILMSHEKAFSSGFLTKPDKTGIYIGKLDLNRLLSSKVIWTIEGLSSHIAKRNILVRSAHLKYANGFLMTRLINKHL